MNTNLLASFDPPGGLSLKEVPLFVSFGFDDNGLSGLEGSGGSGGLSWTFELFEKQTLASVRASFFMKTANLLPSLHDEASYLNHLLKLGLQKGHEFGIHTRSHPHGVRFDTKSSARIPLLSRADWDREIAESLADLADVFSAKSVARGFRTPYLEYNPATFDAVHAAGFTYDSSLEVGWEADSDETRTRWPADLAQAYPSEVWTSREFYGMEAQSGGHPGLLELPIPCLVLPPDERCEEYGLKPGFRLRMKRQVPQLNVNDGKMTGLDWNLFFQFCMSADEALATWKYTLDSRLGGNKAPLLFGGHSDIYSSRYEETEKETGNRDRWNCDVHERRAVLSEMLSYALSKPEVRVVRMADLADWMRKPLSLPNLC